MDTGGPGTSGGEGRKSPSTQNAGRRRGSREQRETGQREGNSAKDQRAAHAGEEEEKQGDVMARQ